MGQAAVGRRTRRASVQPRRAAGDDPRDGRSARLSVRGCVRRCVTCGHIAICGAGRASFEATVEPHGVVMFEGAALSAL